MRTHLRLLLKAVLGAVSSDVLCHAVDFALEKSQLQYTFSSTLFLYLKPHLDQHLFEQY